MKKHTCLLALAFILLQGCGAAPENKLGSSESIIIGSDDFVKVNRGTAVLDKIVNSVGMMALGCTVTHLGDGIAVTAGHCLEDDACRGSQHNVIWGYTSEEDGYMTSQCQEVLASEFTAEKDYAYLRYSPVPRDSLEVNLDDKPQVGDEVTIFSHPSRRTLENSGWCHVSEHMDERFSYGCDTEGGSSGAAVLNSSLEIVGIHNLGNRAEQYNAGTFLTSTPLSVE